MSRSKLRRSSSFSNFIEGKPWAIFTLLELLFVSFVNLGCTKSSQFTDSDLALKNFIAGSIKQIQDNNLAEAEILLLKASLISNDPQIEMMRAKILELSEIDNDFNLIDALNNCYEKQTCSEKLSELQAMYCKGTPLNNLDYKLFIVLGGRGLGDIPGCLKKDLITALSNMKKNFDYYLYFKPKYLDMLDINEKKFLEASEKFFLENKPKYMHQIPSDVIFFLVQ